MTKQIFIVIACFVAAICIYCYFLIHDDVTENNNIEQVDNSNLIQIDTISYINTIDSLQNVINDIQLDIHNYQDYTDSIGAELLVAKYKLERVKYYNNIATGTNIKYLRGWINRVLAE